LSISAPLLSPHANAGEAKRHTAMGVWGPRRPMAQLPPRDAVYRRRRGKTPHLRHAWGNVPQLHQCSCDGGLKRHMAVVGLDNGLDRTHP